MSEREVRELLDKASRSVKAAERLMQKVIMGLHRSAENKLRRALRPPVNLWRKWEPLSKLEAQVHDVLRFQIRKRRQVFGH